MGGVKYLIITADDLGLTESINEGISKAYNDGVVNSVSVIPSGEAFEDALKTIKSLGLKEIGAHLSLTETRPVLNSSKFFKNHNQFFFDFLLKKVDSRGVYEELRAQLGLLSDSGAKITHINSHEHIHIVPEILNIFIALAKEFNIPAIRYPRNDRPAKLFTANDVYRKIMLSYFSGRTKETFKDSGLLYTDSFLGLLDAGKLKKQLLMEMLNGLKNGVTELVCHPGFLSPEVLEGYRWHRGCEEELLALTDNHVKKTIKNNEIQLITYGELSSVKG
ncbi:MAG: ChbG/HpnK family deacetylase [Candidatus Omnitrophota bacterium]|nr:ChbG/HpnK family deacetylase [Candidatus Omnitrophota bacterium]